MKKKMCSLLVLAGMLIGTVPVSAATVLSCCTTNSSCCLSEATSECCKVVTTSAVKDTTSIVTWSLDSATGLLVAQPNFFYEMSLNDLAQ